SLEEIAPGIRGVFPPTTVAARLERPRSAAVLRSGGGEADGEALEGVVQVRADADGVAGLLDGRERRQQLLEEHPALEAGQVGAEAEVLADPERQVGVGVAADVEGLGVL